MSMAVLGLRVDAVGALQTVDQMSGKLRTLGEDGKKSTSILDQVTGAATKLGLAFSTIKAALLIKDAALMAARYETLGVVMNVVGKNSGQSNTAMAKFQAQLEETGISAVSARQNLAKLASANIDLGRSSDIARVAQDAAVIAGTNSADAFDRLTSAIATGNTKMLRTLGIYVDINDGLKKYAAENNTTAGALTGFQRIQANVNTVMAGSTQIAGSYTAAINTVGKQVTSMSRFVDNAKVALGEAFQPQLVSIVTGLSTALKFVSENGQAVAEVVKVISVGLGARIFNAAIMASGAYIAKLGLTRAAMIETLQVQAKSAYADVAKGEAAVAAAEREVAAGVAIKASKEQLIAAELRLTAARRGLATATVVSEAAELTLATTTTLTSRAMAGATVVARGFWAAIGGPIGAIIIGVYAFYSAIQALNERALAPQKARTEAVQKVSDEYADSLHGLSTAALNAAEAQQTLNKAQADAEKLSAGKALEGVKAGRSALKAQGADVTSDAISKQVAAEAAAQERFAKASDASTIASANLNAILKARAPLAKQEEEETAALIKKFKAEQEAASLQLERQNALNAAFGSTAAVIDNINAAFDRKGKIAKIDADFTKEQTAALTDFINRSSAAEQVSRDLAEAETLRITAGGLDLRVTQAKQELDLVKKIGLEAALQIPRNRAANEIASATLTLKGKERDLTIAAIQAEEVLAEATIKAARAKSQGEENDTRVRLAKQSLELVGLEGEALARLQIQQTALNANKEAELSLTGEELAARQKVIKTEEDIALAVLRGNTLLDERKARQDVLNEQAKKYLEEQKRQAEEFQRAFEGTLSNGIAAVLKDGKDGFHNFTKSVKEMFLKMFADILSAQVFKKMASSLAAFLPGSANGKAGGAGGLAGGVLGVGLASGAVGYGVGSQTANKGLGALGGAASGALTGAALGSIVPVVGTAVGAVVGALAGMVGGILGSAKAAKENAAANKALWASYELSKKAQQDLANGASPLSSELTEVAGQFIALRQQLESSKPKNTGNSKLNAILQAQYQAELGKLNKLEAERIAQIKAEFAQAQQRAQEDLKVRSLLAQGRDAEARALEFANAQIREYQDAVKGGADATTLAVLAQTQLEEATKRAADAAKAEAAVKEQNRRQDFDVANATRALTDPRGANGAAAAEEAQRRIFDAITAGATEAQLAALALYNTALEAKRIADQLEDDTRTREGLTARALAASGNVRGAEDATNAARQRQELVDAIAAGMTPGNLALLRFTQLAERSQLEMQRAIADQTKAIQEQTAATLEAFDKQITAIQDGAAAQIKAIDKQIDAINEQTKLNAKKYDEQIATAKDQLKRQTDAIDLQVESMRSALESANKQVSTLQKTVDTNGKIVETMQALRDSLKLGANSTFSPEDKLAEAKRQFEAVAAAAQGGDSNAANNLPQAANALLEASRGFNASGAGYVTDFNRVQDVLAAVQEKFGAQLPIDQQTLEQAKQQVEYLQQGIDGLQKQKELLQATSEKNIAAIEAAKQQAAEDAQKLIDLLGKEKEKISADATAQIAAINEQKLAVQKAAEDQIAKLTLVQQEAHLARLKQDEYWQQFLGISGTSTPETGGPTPGTAAGYADAGNQKTIPAQQLDEIKQQREALGTDMKDLKLLLERLIKALAVGTDEEVQATNKVTGAIAQLAQETRAAAQGAAVRTGYKPK